MNCIKFGKVNKQLLIPIIGGVVLLIFISLISLNPKYKIIRKNPFILSIYSSIGLIFNFIPYLIIKCRSNNYIKETRFTKYKLIFYSSLIGFFQTFLL
jgi:hypothetical protein